MGTNITAVPPLEGAAASALHASDGAWAQAYERVLQNAWDDPALTLREKHLVFVALSAAITNVDTRTLSEQTAAALAAGATEAEIREILKMGAILSLHSMSLGAPILIEEAAALGKTQPAAAVDESRTPAIAKMKSIGQWNVAWDPFASLDPLWTDAFIAAGTGFYTSGIFSPKFMELLSIAFDVSITHMYAPGVRRHIKGALALGATQSEIFAVLKLCVSYGSAALNYGLRGAPSTAAGSSAG